MITGLLLWIISDSTQKRQVDNLQRLREIFHALSEDSCMILTERSKK